MRSYHITQKVFFLRKKGVVIHSHDLIVSININYGHDEINYNLLIMTL